MGKYLRISSNIRKPFLIHIWHCKCSTLNFLIYEENLIFFFISVPCLCSFCAWEMVLHGVKRRILPSYWLAKGLTNSPPELRGFVMLTVQWEECSHISARICRASFRENKPKTLVFQWLENERFGLVFAKTGSINSATEVLWAKITVESANVVLVGSTDTFYYIQ